MRLYHGSNVAVKAPRIIVSNQFLDFGAGFYTTTNLAQAREFARKVAVRNKCGCGTVSVYELDDAALEELEVRQFPAVPDEAWLEFVVANRSGRDTGERADIVIGPVANDNVYRTIGLYMAGVLSRRGAIEDLRVRELFTQIVFTTEKGLAALRFAGEEAAE